ncbi:MAG: peptide deformylase [Planctomycetota bacterium]
MTDAYPYPDILETLHYPDPRLRCECQPVRVFNQALRDVVARMWHHMYAERGIGLAAPQVGIAQSFFVTDHATQDGKPGDPRVFINPHIEHGRGESIFEEGCLSVPGIWAKVRRYNQFDLVYQDLDGQEQREHFDIANGDFLGTVTQHELDHLHGILFIDHLSPLQVNLLRRRLKGLEKDYKKTTGRTGQVLRR